MTEIKRKKYREAHPEGVRKHQKRAMRRAEEETPPEGVRKYQRSKAGERPVLQQHQTRAGGTVIMLNGHFVL